MAIHDLIAALVDALDAVLLMDFAGTRRSLRLKSIPLLSSAEALAMVRERGAKIIDLRYGVAAQNLKDVIFVPAADLLERRVTALEVIPHGVPLIFMDQNIERAREAALDSKLPHEKYVAILKDIQALLSLSSPGPE